MDYALDERIERYLNGAMTSEETLRFERDLANPEIGRGFREALLIRELMKSSPPEVPDGLVERIQDTLGLASPAESAPASARKKGAAGMILDSLAWMYRGPALAVTAPRAGTGGAATAGFKAGLSGFRSMLAPVGALSPMKRTKAAAPAKQPGRLLKMLGR